MAAGKLHGAPNTAAICKSPCHHFPTQSLMKFWRRIVLILAGTIAAGGLPTSASANGSVQREGVILSQNITAETPRRCTISQRGHTSALGVHLMNSWWVFMGEWLNFYC